MTARKKLIEVVLPLAAINGAPAKEKSIRCSYPLPWSPICSSMPDHANLPACHRSA